MSIIINELLIIWRGNCCVAGGWGGQMLWEAEALEGNGKMAESEQTKTQNSWVNDEQKNL